MSEEEQWKDEDEHPDDDWSFSDEEIDLIEDWDEIDEVDDYRYIDEREDF